MPCLRGRAAFGPDGTRFAYTHGPGFYTTGETMLGAWLAANPAQRAKLSKSLADVVAAMSVVEGGLEAVNSYDAAHLSFGIFQWTVGVGNGAGELAVLLAQFKAAAPDAFQDYFGGYGLDAIVTSQASTTGLLALDGNVLNSSAQKDPLRGIEWAYRFWRAGHDETLRACQFSFAGSRIARFSSSLVCSRPVREWVTSELGMALMLDEHVNRPGHVPATLGNAIKSLGKQASDPSGWSTKDEQALLTAYLVMRGRTDMTDSNARAGKIEQSVRAGTLSEERGSFVAV